MREFQNKRRFKEMLHSRYALGVLFLLCLLMVRPVFNAYEKFQKSKLIRAQTQKEYALVEDRRDLLDKKIAALGTLQGKEREVREKFGFVKEGERVIVLIEEATDEKQGGTVSDQGVWGRLFSFVKSIF